MPCRGPDPKEEAAEESLSLRMELDEATRVACKAIKLLNKNSIPIPFELNKWRQKHDALDTVRKKQVQAKIEALDKQRKELEKELED